MKKTPEVHVIVSTEAGAEGVNLQAANVLVNYDLPWNPMVLEQRIGRVQRLGSEHAVVTILNLVIAKSVEERVVARLAEKLQMIGDAVGEIDAILESPGASKGDDVGESFQDMVRKLVVKSLQGKSTEEAVRREEASIDEAKRLFSKNQKVIDEQLAGLDELHTSGPATPDLPVREPGMLLEEFVLVALAEDGAVVTKCDDGILGVVSQDGQRFQAMIGVAPDGGAPRDVTIYAPGEPAFELLVERWANQHGALVHDLRGAPDEVLRAIAERWCAQVPSVVLRDVRRSEAREVFQGEAHCAAQAVVAHDEYETIVSVDLRPEGHDKIPDEQPPSTRIAERAQVSSLFEGAAQVIEAAVENDAGIREFCRFYGERRAEELRRAQQGSEAVRVVEESFTPVLNASAVGVRGHRYEVVRLHLAVELDAVPYETEIEVVPPTSQIITGPTMGACGKSGRSVPATWLEACCESKKRVLRHLLEPSERSGRRALPEHLERSVITGQRLLVSEMEASDVSKKLAEPELLETSEMSQRKGLPSEIALCDFSQTKVLKDELETSDISGRRLRRDRKVVCAVSGKVGDKSEFVKCEVSGADVLEEETVLSDVSRRRFRRDWLVTSEKPPHRVGARTEDVKCAHTKKRLLRDEVEMSAASGKWMEKSLLVKSEASELRALPEELIPCAKSGKRVLPSETDVCLVTGQRALRDLMVKSAVTGRFMLRGHETRSALSNKPMARTEAFTCPWLGDLLLPEEAIACRLTGLPVAPRALNAQGELDALRQVLDNPSGGADAPNVVAWLKQIRLYSWNEPRWARAVTSPGGKLWAVAVHAEAFLTSIDDGMLVGVGPGGGIAKAGPAYAVGDRRQQGWTRGRSARW